jgi:hypothetical protein
MVIGKLVCASFENLLMFQRLLKLVWLNQRIQLMNSKLLKPVCDFPMIKLSMLYVKRFLLSEFARISNYESAQEARQILETTYEDTKLVKSAKLQMLISRFEEIKMLEDETLGEFYKRINDLRNSMVNLGKMVSDVKLIWKILRSLPKCFRIKVTTIEEIKDLESMKIEEFVGSLQTYEYALPPVKKAKAIALKASKKNAKVSIMNKMQWQCWLRTSGDWWRMINWRRSSLKQWRRPPKNLSQNKLRRRIQ